MNQKILLKIYSNLPYKKEFQIHTTLEKIFKKSYRNNGNEDVLKVIRGSSTVLDVGCGGGDNARLLLERKCIVDGITISEIELEEAFHYLRKGYLFNLENGLPDEVKQNRYDYVICSHVLEHICYPKKLLADIRECLLEGGQLIIALPNLMHYRSRWELVKGNFNYKDMGIWDNTHFKWYTFETGARLIKENGFELIHQTVSGGLPAASLFSRILPVKFSEKLYRQIIKISPGFFGYQLLYHAKK